MNKGNLIVFTGIDGSGKTTQTEMIIDSLRRDGINVSYVWCRWDPLLVKPLMKMWKGGIAEKAKDIDDSNRKIKNKKKKLLNNPVFRWLWLLIFFIDYGLQIFVKIRIPLASRKSIISDRIFYDAVIDQSVNLGEKNTWLLNSLDSYWIRILFPKPDMVIYIDCPEDIALSRKNDTPDIGYLIERRKLYLQLASKYKWTIFDGTQPVDVIARLVKEKIYGRLKL